MSNTFSCTFQINPLQLYVEIRMSLSDILHPIGNQRRTMATPTTPIQLPRVQSQQLLSPGSPGNNSLPSNVWRCPPPYNRNQGTLFTFQPNSNVLPGSVLIPDAQYVMNPNGQSVANKKIMYFAPVPILSNLQVSFYLPFQNNVTNVIGIANDPIYAVGGRVTDSSGNEYGYLDQMLVCWL